MMSLTKDKHLFLYLPIIWRLSIAEFDVVDPAEFDNFDDDHFGSSKLDSQLNGVASQSASGSLAEKDSKQTALPRPQGLPTIIKTRTLSLGSLPDLHVGEDSNSEGQGDLLGATPDELTHSSPQIYHTEQNADLLTPSAANDRDLSCQTHHSTAPDLKTLELNGHEENPDSIAQTQSPNMRISFSDDGLKNYTLDLPGVPAAGGQRSSALSKIKSGLSQVSHLIVNPNSSPHTRRRKQVLEAQLLDNSMKSKLRFKNCQTKILLL